MWPFRSAKERAREAYRSAVREYEDAKKRRDFRDLHRASEALTQAMHARMKAGA